MGDPWPISMLGLDVNHTLNRVNHPQDFGHLEIIKDYPFLRPLYTQAELDSEPSSLQYFTAHTMGIACLLTFFYLVLVFWGKILMETRAPLTLRWSSRVWNLSLSLFSTVGSLRTAPHLMYLISKFGWFGATCYNPVALSGTGASGLWTALFIFSKVPELIDTFFIVARKAPLIRLHWYHHVTVLLFCWHSYATISATGLVFISMNYTVHAIMYMYYFLVSFAWGKVLRRFKVFVTLIQTSQMVVGVGQCFLIHYARGRGLVCSVDGWNYKLGAFMYFSYFILFADILVKFAKDFIVDCFGLNKKKSPAGALKGTRITEAKGDKSKAPKETAMSPSKASKAPKASKGALPPAGSPYRRGKWSQ